MNDSGRHITARHAIIISGSLGGLFTAVTLRAIGWTFEMIERSPHALDSRGGGLVLQPDVLAALRFAGIRHGDDIGVPSGDRIYLDQNDEVVHRSFMPQTQTSWGTLYAMMRDTIAAGDIHSGEEFVGFEPRNGKVHAFFASGRSAVGDLLVGADGPHSTLRELLRPGSLPRYAGYVAWPPPSPGRTRRAARPKPPPTRWRWPCATITPASTPACGNGNSSSWPPATG